MIVATALVIAVSTRLGAVLRRSGPREEHAVILIRVFVIFSMVVVLWPSTATTSRSPGATPILVA
jgi:hypothetical protein